MFTKNKTNVCKGIGILFLLFHHLFRTPTMILNNNVDFGSMNIDTINIFATSLRVCVWIFAFLSAYGLAFKYKRTPKEKRHSFVPTQWLNLMKPFWFIFIIAVGVFVFSGHSIVLNTRATFCSRYLTSLRLRISSEPQSFWACSGICSSLSSWYSRYLCFTNSAKSSGILRYYFHSFLCSF